MHKFRLRHSKFHRKLEALTRRPEPPGDLSEILAKLQKQPADQPLATIADDAGLVESEHERHVQQAWFQQGADAKERDQVVRAAYQTLAEALLDKWRPVKMVWLEGGDDFDVVVDLGESQITYIVITPGDAVALEASHVENADDGPTKQFFMEGGEVRKAGVMMKREPTP